MLIALDPGHGGSDPGAVGNGLLEKDITLKLALKTGTILRTQYDCDVMYTRNRDVSLTLSERASIANRSKADLFCSFHINSFNATAKGFETFRYSKTTKEKSIELQKNVHEEVMKALKPYGIMDRGMKAENFAVVRETIMPALLTETLFISNPNEAKLLKSDAFLDQVAAAHAAGIAKVAGLKSAEKKHYLMIGSFSSKAEAEKNAKMLKEEYGWVVHVKEG
ncbi:N-acetylmuramoyl-L-alanine amidase [Cytobacillus sp. FJAT-53684]|uniref:N-acetylmuramoyl-L-alanine amidase n=1 Tax=Cytobacillus mangrovibacter TaxID=3299024 RepID=A0ABW6K2J8_9BACI